MTDKALLQRALDALTSARDSVSNELSGIINHPSNARIIECVTDDLAKADAAIDELRAALAAPAAPAITKGSVLNAAKEIGLIDWMTPDCDWFSFSSEQEQASAMLVELVSRFNSASVGDKPATSEPVAWISPHGMPHDQYVPGDAPLYTAPHDAPPSLVLVPVEPTPAMTEAGSDAGEGHDWCGARPVYAAMLAAAPKAPT